MKNFRQYKEEMNPPNQQDDGEDKNLKSKEKRQQQIKKMVLLKKMQAVRAGAGADIVASHEPEGEMVEGSLHKWFSGSKSKDGKPGWVQSDGSPCANEPGETKTPKCYSSAKRASMSKKNFVQQMQGRLEKILINSKSLVLLNQLMLLLIRRKKK